MCSLEIMEKVRRKLDKRAVLGLAGATVAMGAASSARAAKRGGGVYTPANASVQDLTHAITADFPVFPGYDKPRFRNIKSVEADGFYANEVSFAEHTGTHLDAPAHFATGGATAELIPVECLVAPLAVIDISQRAARDPDSRLMKDDVLAWEEEHGLLPEGSLVAMYSGWEERLRDAGRFLNLDGSGTPHFPGFDPGVAEFLVHEREVVGLGVDTLSIDVGATFDNGAHQAVLGADAYGLENLANLKRVPPRGACLVAGSLKYKGASGGPARVLALFGETISAERSV